MLSITLPTAPLTPGRSLFDPFSLAHFHIVWSGLCVIETNAPAHWLSFHPSPSLFVREFSHLSYGIGNPKSEAIQAYLDTFIA